MLNLKNSLCSLDHKLFYDIIPISTIAPGDVIETDIAKNENEIEITPAPSDVPVSTDTPTPTPFFYGDDDDIPLTRDVYDGDVSDSILQKLSAYYNKYGDNSDYVIFRSGQYDYYLIFGDNYNGTFNNATICHYYITYNGYTSNGAYFVIDSRTSITPDISGYTGFVYANDYYHLPSKYIDDYQRFTYKMVGISSIIICLSFLLAVIGIWVSKMRKRWL